MDAQPSFKLPKSFLNQLGEFTTGYVLITVNNAGEFETFIHSDSPVIRLGLSQFTGHVADLLNGETSTSFQEGRNEGAPELEDGDSEEASA